MLGRCGAERDCNTAKLAGRIGDVTAPSLREEECHDLPPLSDSLSADHGRKTPPDRALQVPPVV